MNVRKQNFYAVATLAVAFFCLVVLCSNVRAETISEHDRQDMALQKAIQLCQAKGGTFSWSMPERYRLTDDPQGYRILGNELLVICTVKTGASSGWSAKWVAPTKRTDGSALPLSEIRGYQIMSGGAVLAMVSGTMYAAKGEPPPGLVALRTVDTDGQVSADSEGVRF